jgi:uncharacterized protein (DUF58 family)
VNFKRLNHILIPSTKDGRDAFRSSRLGRLVRPLFSLYVALTPEGRFLSVFALLTGAAGLEVGANQIYLLFSLITGLLAASLVARRFFRLDAVTLTVEAPRVVTVGETMTVSLALQNRSRRDATGLRAIGPLLPWDGRFLASDPHLSHLGAGETGRIRVNMVFSSRGDHHIDPFYVGRTVPLGVAIGPVIPSDGVRFIVRPVPAIVQSLRRSAGQGAGSSGGRHLAPDAADLAGTRPYRPGDPVRDLHARSWARTGFPVVREYRQDPSVAVLLLVDLEPEQSSQPLETLEAVVALASGIVMRLDAEAAAPLAFGLGERLEWLQQTPGATEVILDSLARAPLVAHPAERWLRAILPESRRFSDVVWVAASVTEDRLAVLARLRAVGLPVRMFVPAASAAPDPAAPDPAVMFVPVDAIGSGRPLAL